MARKVAVVLFLLLAATAAASDKFAGGVKADSVDVSTFAILRSTTDNTGTTGKAFGDFACMYWRQGGSATAITEASLANEAAAHADGGIVEVDAGLPGVYRVDWPDAAFATGADWVLLGCVVTGSYEWIAGYALETSGASENATAIATVDTNVDAILADTGTDGVVLSTATKEAIADAILNRNINVTTDPGNGGRTVEEALSFLRNKWTIVGTTLSIYDESDAGAAIWTATIGVDASADPVTSSDPP